MAGKLTNKQKTFINAYLANGFNATQAAIKAGYSEKTARQIGSENLTKPVIRAAIDERLSTHVMTADEALARLSAQARGSMIDFMDEKLRTLDLIKADRANQLHLIKKFSHTKTAKSETISIELYDAQAALVHIIKETHLKAGEATDRTEVIDTLSDDERAAKIAALLDKARARRDRQSPSE